MIFQYIFYKFIFNYVWEWVSLLNLLQLNKKLNLNLLNNLTVSEFT